MRRYGCQTAYNECINVFVCVNAFVVSVASVSYLKSTDELQTHTYLYTKTLYALFFTLKVLHNSKY